MRLTKLLALKSASHGNNDDASLFLKRIGIWGFAFFAIKGIFWIIISFSLIMVGSDN